MLFILYLKKRKKNNYQNFVYCLVLLNWKHLHQTSFMSVTGNKNVEYANTVGSYFGPFWVSVLNQTNFSRVTSK